MDGFRFECIPGCTKCCDVRGFVYLSESDLKRAARLLGLSAGEFERRYVYQTKHLLRLRKPRNSQCHFLTDQGCRIHPAKPTQCRTYPFWPELVGDPVAWRAAGAECPGIGKGPLISIQSAITIADEMRQAYPAMYED